MEGNFTLDFYNYTIIRFQRICFRICFKIGDPIN